MSALILNRISLARLSYADLLPELEGELLMICDRHAFPTDPLEAQSLYRRYKHIELVDRYDSSGMVELIALRLFERFGFERIIAVSEFDLLRAARLRDRLGLSGQGEQSAMAFRDKLLMKSLAAAAGISVPVCRAIHNPMDVLSFVQVHGLPVVIKPILGAGAVNTHIVRTQEQLEALLDSVLFASADLSPGLEIETYVAGHMYYIDGFRLNGVLRAIWPSRYLNTCHDFSHGSVLGSFTLGPENPLAERLCSFTRRVLRALPTPETTAFHCEVFHTPSDEIVLCEVASRVGGPRTPELFEHALGFDLVDAFIRGQAGLMSSKPFSVSAPTPSRLGGELLLPTPGGTLTAAPESCSLPGVLHYALGAELGQSYAPSQDVGDFIASVLFSARSEDEMMRQIRGVADWFSARTVWSAPQTQPLG